MDRIPDELCRDYEKCVLANHDSQSQEQSLEVAGSVSSEATSSIIHNLQLQPSMPCENGYPHFPSWFIHDFSRLSTQEPLIDELARSQTSPALQAVTSTISARRGINFNLTPFDGLPRSPAVDMGEASSSNTATSWSDKSNPSDALTRVSSFPITIRSPSIGPPTPPLEADLSSWLVETPVTGFVTHSVDPSATAVPSHQPLTSDVNHVVHQAVPTTSTTELSNLNFAGTPWFQTVLKLTCATMETDTLTLSLKIISQILPMNATDQRPVKTYEMICDRIQQVSNEPRSINITHARKISPGQVVEDFPKSPPATPYRNGGDSYFGDQTIFTHVAEVPVHHDLRFATQNTETVAAQRHIMTPEANSIILERYIPPTTADETLDLFEANSCRSYLADRLPELAPSAGSLLFIYPTKTGAETFARRYVGPVLDPLLREMSILKGLNTNAAERLGRMRSIESMFEFGEMKEKLQQFCDSMNSRIAFRRTRTEFRIEHSNTAHINLDRDTWMTWFVEQEQSRMKQDLVDYHREGGQLPDTENTNTEVTAGMLSREITDGLRKSSRPAGDTGVEVGVFVIRRHRKSA